jgi:acyl-CoA thioesterase I
MTISGAGISSFGMRMKKAYRSYAAHGALLQAALLLSACGERQEDVVAGTDASVTTAPVRTAPAPASTPVTGPKRSVLAFGDSLYAGYGLKSGQSLPDAVQQRLRAAGIDAALVNAGVSGDTTAAGRQRLVYTLDHLDRAPDLVLLGLGGNDVLRQVDPAETRANLAAMLDELARRRIPVVLTGMLAPPNLGPDFATRFNAIWPELARKHQAVLYPFILDGVLGDRALMLPDGVHPNAQGVARIADRVTPLVRKRLEALPAA